MLNEAGWPLLKWDAEKHPRDARGRFSLAVFSPRKTIARLSVLSRHNRLTADYGYSRTKELPDSVLDYSIDSTAISDYLYANKGKLPLSGRGSKSKQKRLISGLDAAIKAHKTKRDISVFTGVATDIGALKPGKDGNIYTRNYAYTSTSIDPSVARRFARVSGPTGGYVNIVKIKVPSGFSGIYLGDAANAASERELLLPRGLRLKINPTPTVFSLKDFSHGRRKSYVWDAEIVSGLRKVDDEVELEAPILDSELLKWDEAEHPRGAGGKFTQSQRRLLRMGVPRRVLAGAAGRVKLVTPEMVGVEARGRFGATAGLAGLFSPGKSVSLRGAAQRAGNPGPRLINAIFGAPTANRAGLFERIRRSPSHKGTGTVLVGDRVYGAPLSSSEHPLTNTTRASRRAVALHEALHSVDLASGKKFTLSSHPDFVRAFLSERYGASIRSLYGASNRIEAFAEAARALMTPHYNPSSAAVKEKIFSGRKISVAERKNPGLPVDLDPSSKIRALMPKTVRVARRLLLAARYLKKGAIGKGTDEIVDEDEREIDDEDEHEIEIVPLWPALPSWKLGKAGFLDVDEVELEAPILDSELLKWDEGKHPRGKGGRFKSSFSPGSTIRGRVKEGEVLVYRGAHKDHHLKISDTYGGVFSSTQKRVAEAYARWKDGVQVFGGYKGGDLKAYAIPKDQLVDLRDASTFRRYKKWAKATHKETISINRFFSEKRALREPINYGSKALAGWLKAEGKVGILDPGQTGLSPQKTKGDFEIAGRRFHRVPQVLVLDPKVMRLIGRVALRKASFLDVERAAAATNATPTAAQVAAGNYKKGIVKLHGLTIRIENPAGSVRHGVGRDGKEWSATMPAHYGYISGTKGFDGDEVDVWIGPVPDLAHVYVINQLRLGTDRFDEHKVGMGFHHESDFLSVYRMAYPNLNADDLIHNVVRMPVWRLKRWLASGRPAKQMAKMAEVSSGRYLKSRLAAMYCKTHGRDLALFGPYIGVDGRRRVVVQDRETKRKWSVAYAKVKLEALTGKPLGPGFEADHKNNDRTNDAARNLVALNSYENKAKSGKYRRSLAKAKQRLTAEDVATLSEGRIARMIERTMAWARGDVIDDIIAGLKAGADPAEVAREVAAGEGLSEKLNSAADALEAVYAQAGQEAADQSGGKSKRLVAFQFDARNPKSATYFDEYRLWLVREMSAEQEATIQTIAREGILSGKSLDAVARDLRVTVGLTAYQARNVMNYRRELEDLEPAAMLRALRDRRYDSTIRRAIESGDALTPEQITKMVEAYHRRYVAYRSVTIARTEGLRAANMGVMASAYQAIDDGVVRPQDVVKRWIAKIDDKTRDSHAKLNGQQIRGVDSPFRASSGALLAFPGDPSAPAAETINCLLPGTRVLAMDVRAASSREYDGDAVTIKTAGGAELSCTINHPVLTARGWVPAQLIEPGDRVVRCNIGEWDLLIDDDQNAPPRVEDVEHALRAAGGAALTKVAAGMDFHGEGGAGQVDVVSADMKLIDAGYAALQEPARKDRLSPATPQFPGESHLGAKQHLGVASAPPSGGAMSRGHLMLSRLLAHLAPLEKLGLFPAPEAPAVPAEDALDRGAGNREPGGHGFDRGAAVVVGQELGEIDGLPSRPGAALWDEAAEIFGHRDLVELDEVVAVVRSRWRGLVRNLETGSGMYLAEGIVNHNCRCSLAFTMLPPNS